MQKREPRRVPGRPPPAAQQLPLFQPQQTGQPLDPPPPTRHTWPYLLARVFAVDILTCPSCDGSMRVLLVAKTPEQARVVLAASPPRSRAPPRPTGQLELDLTA